MWSKNSTFPVLCVRACVALPTPNASHSCFRKASLGEFLFLGITLVARMSRRVRHLCHVRRLRLRSAVFRPIPCRSSVSSCIVMMMMMMKLLEIAAWLPSLPWLPQLPRHLLFEHFSCYSFFHFSMFSFSTMFCIFLVFVFHVVVIVFVERKFPN